MRVLTAMFAALCVFAGACRTMPDLSQHESVAPALESDLTACADGLPQQSGPTGFGAYIGTWQANHRRIPDSADYAIATGSGRVGVRCSASNYVIAESITLTFHVPTGRALQFALTDLPADAKKIYDHSHDTCRSLQYRSPTLSAQLPRDDRAGLVDIAITNQEVDLRIGLSLRDDSRPCQGL